MVCPKCGSENVLVQSEAVNQKSSHKGNGCLWSFGRLVLIICTCGLWLIIGGHKGTSKTKIKHKTACVCQNCANKWYAN